MMKVGISGLALAMAAALVLSACGGGGGDGGGPGGEASLSDKLRRFAGGEPTLALPAEQAVALDRELAGRLTHTLEGSVHGLDGRTLTRQEPLSAQPMPEMFEPQAALPEGFVYRPVLEHGGFRLINLSGMHTLEVADIGETITIAFDTYMALGAWSRFSGGRALVCPGAGGGPCDDSGGMPPDGSFLSWSADSDGHYGGADPAGTGSASWTGLLFGFDVTRYEPGTARTVVGEARIEIDDLARPDVDVAFTGIREVASGRARADMTWDGLPLTDGAFTDSADGGARTIAGAFHGPAQEEVGGVFDRDGIAGAFGAGRR